MKPMVAARRFLMPGGIVSLLAYVRYRATVSPRAEVELSPLLHLGRGVAIASFVKIKASEGPVRIGARTSIGAGCFIGGHATGIAIGADCLISPNVAIVGVNYRYGRTDMPIREQGLVSRGPVTIGDNVWIGVGAVVLDGATIGDGAIVAPLSLVSGTVAPNAIVQGNPAKEIFVRR